jgi:predicted membrane channel-forming protein YqfA (hemolysin III family)
MSEIFIIALGIITAILILIYPNEFSNLTTLIWIGIAIFTILTNKKLMKEMKK